MTIYFIGAGTGDPELITVKGAKILAKADIIFYDALVNNEIFVDINTKCKLINVGKRCGQPSFSQQQINQLLIQANKDYSIVVRLKGGDPMIFARINEEINSLKHNNIQFVIIPGITAATAAAASLALPLTIRGISRGVQFRTLASHDKADIGIDSDNDTLVFYMGKNQCEQIYTQLILKNYKLTTNIYLIENISLKSERHLKIQLEQLNTSLVKDWISDAPLLVIVESRSL